MAFYTLRYILNFDGGPQGGEPYTLEFYFKNYIGDFENVIGVEAAVIDRWDKDEPKPGVKGRSIEIVLLNKNRTLPLESFFAIADDHCKIIYKWRSQVMFEGFLVQDDCREPMLDYSHPISLLATDNLGLLKDVPFNEANLVVGDGDRVITGVNVNSLVLPISGINQLVIYQNPTGALVGDTILIEGTPGSDGVYTIAAILTSGGLTFLDITTVFPFPIPGALTYTVTLITPADLRDRLSLAYLIRICLHATTLSLLTDVYANIIETITATPRYLEETFISGNDFSNGNNNWKSSYEVLEIIIGRFKGSLFQAEGKWNIKRSDEHIYYDNLISGFRYTTAMVYSNDIFFDDIFETAPNIDPAIAGPATFPESGITKSILRPYKFDRETFNYKQPADLLCNYNLQKLGSYIRQFSVGSIIYKDYEMPCWFNGPFAPFPTHHIRVGFDTIANIEISRVAVIGGLTGDSSRSVGSEPIEVGLGDTCTFQYSFRTDGSQAGPIFFIIAFGIFDGVNTWYLQNDDTWSNSVGPGKRFNVPSGSNTIDWQNVNITTSRFPVSGLLTVYLNDHQNVPSPTSETYISNISLEVTALVSDSTKITGHQHTDTQQPTIKNDEDIEIFIDDSPRPSIAGTMFLSTTTGVLRDQTTLWSHPIIPLPRRLGEWTTREQLLWRKKERTKMEGTMYGIVQRMRRLLKTELVFSQVLGVNHIDIAQGITDWYFAGQLITILGTTLNDGVYTVTGTTAGGVTVIEAVSGETITALASIANVQRHISMLTLIKYSGLQDKNFIFGTLSVDYKYNKFNGTFWEQWSDLNALTPDVEYREIASGAHSFVATAPNRFVVANTVASSLIIGDKLELTGTAVAGTYTIALVILVGTDYVINFVEAIGTLSGATLINVSRKLPVDFSDYYNFRYLYETK